MPVLIRLFRIAWRFSTLIVFLAMLGLNVATLTVAGVATVANGALAAVGVGTVAGRSAAAAPRRATIRAATRRVSARVARGAARSASSVFVESVPWIGAAAVIGVTALDLRDACATMDDLKELDAALGPQEPAAPADEASMLDDVTAEVCALRVPTLAEIRAGIGDGIGAGAPPSP